MTELKPEPRPSKNCGACKTFEKDSYKICYCQCHNVGNYMVGFHHSFNYILKDFEIKEKTDLKWG